jgi:ABC-2 type transport system permease protein
MPSKTSLFRREMFKRDFRHVGWISILFFCSLAFTLPLQLLMAFNDDYRIDASGAGLFDSTFMFELQFMFLFLMPVLMAVFLFRYIHVKGASDFIHSLPISREHLFRHHVLSGLILLIVPILVNSLILFMFYLFADVSTFYSINQLGYWTLMMIIVSILTFMICVFAGTLTGISAVQAVLTYILMLLPAGIYVLVAVHISFFIAGLSDLALLDHTIGNYSPIVKVFQFYPDQAQGGFLPVNSIMLFIYFIASVVFYFAGKAIYKKRPLEVASQTIAINLLKPVFQFGMTFCFALVGGTYFGETQLMLSWLIFGYVVGGLIGYFLSSMVLDKSWRVFQVQYLKGLFVYGGTAGIVIGILPLFWLNYESYVPEMSNVKNVYIGDSVFQLEDLMANTSPDLIESEEAIGAVIQLQKEMIKKNDQFNSRGKRYFISYELENGDHVQRTYQIDRKEVQASLKRVMETEDYKELTYPVLNSDSSKVQKVTLQPGGPVNTEVSILEPKQIQEFYQHVREDIYALSYEDIIHPVGIRSHVSEVRNGSDWTEKYYYPHDNSIYNSYENTVNWLKEEGYYEDAFIDEGEIDHVSIYPWNEAQNQYPREAYDQIVKNESVEPLEVKNKKQIQTMLLSSEEDEEGDYLVGIHYDDLQGGYYEVLALTSSKAPDFVEDYFKDEQQ